MMMIHLFVVSGDTEEDGIFGIIVITITNVLFCEPKKGCVINMQQHGMCSWAHQINYTNESSTFGTTKNWLH